MEQNRQHQPDERDRRQRQSELEIGQVRETADHDVLRVAGDRGRGADVRRHRDREEIRRRLPLQVQRQLQHERRQHEADRVVDQEG